jgi:hypothetical protein
MDEKDHIYKRVNSILKGKGSKSSYIGEDDFVSLVKSGITINFHIKNPSLNLENIFRTVKRAQKLSKEKLSFDPQNIEIDIYESIQEMREEGRSRSRYASWIAGIYDGRIRIISERDEEDPESLYIILTHEIIHLAIDELGGGLCPYWLDEGLAVFLSQELPDHYLKYLETAVKKNKILPLETLEKPLFSNLDESIRQLAYSQLFGITEFLEESLGWKKIRSAIIQCRRRPIKAILADLSLNYYLIEQDWKRWARKRFA